MKIGSGFDRSYFPRFAGVFVLLTAYHQINNFTPHQWKWIEHFSALVLLSCAFKNPVLLLSEKPPVLIWLHQKQSLSGALLLGFRHWIVSFLFISCLFLFPYKQEICMMTLKTEYFRLCKETSVNCSTELHNHDSVLLTTFSFFHVGIKKLSFGVAICLLMLQWKVILCKMVIKLSV